MAGRILGKDHRTSRCGRFLLGSAASVCIRKGGGAYVAGVETCGSVWACPVCAGKIAEGRRAEVAECLTGHNTAGGHVYMIALTIPHQRMEDCTHLRKVVSDGWTRFISGKAWNHARKAFGILGFIRALEVTHGENGWHPHLHCLLLTSALSELQAEEFRIWITERWISIVQRIGDRTPSIIYGVNFKRADTVRGAGDYVSKWGVDSEIAKAHMKISKNGGRSPWQLLKDAMEGDYQAHHLFREYATSFKGARHLTWSKGLRKLYVAAPVLTDEQLADASTPFHGDTVVGTLPRPTWIKICTSGLVVNLLEAAEAGGWAGVTSLMRVHKIVPTNCILDGARPQ